MEVKKMSEEIKTICRSTILEARKSKTLDGWSVLKKLSDDVIFQ